MMYITLPLSRHRSIPKATCMPNCRCAMIDSDVPWNECHGMPWNEHGREFGAREAESNCDFRRQ